MDGGVEWNGWLGKEIIGKEGQLGRGEECRKVDKEREANIRTGMRRMQEGRHRVREVNTRTDSNGKNIDERKKVKSKEEVNGWLANGNIGNETSSKGKSERIHRQNIGQN